MKHFSKLVLASVILAAAPIHAAVTADEALRLKADLTPLGGERAGNKEGTIPAWTGGMTVMPNGGAKGDIPLKPFPSDKPVLVINAKNVTQHASKLSDGTIALIKAFPDTFELEVYPTHRTAAASKAAYDNTFKNATNCKLISSGNSVAGCYGGIPFPIPKSGSEAIWNNILRVEPEAEAFTFQNLVGTSDGKRIMATKNDIWWQHPYNYKDGSVETWSGEYFLERFSTMGPPFKAGESLVIRDSIDTATPRQTWQYLVGQRRVRRAPTVGYDTPDFVASGANYFDEVQGFLGAPDRYKWKLIGKKEMYIPYNTNALQTTTIEDAFAPHHFNSKKLRWELHRVWVVEATLAPGKRHAVPKRTFYLDEDSWTMPLMDGYDSQGKLWRTSQVPGFAVPSVPVYKQKPALVFNLQARTYSGVQIISSSTYRVIPRKNENFFTGDAVAADSSR